MKTIGRVAVLAVAFMLITAVLGWWGVGAAGVLWGWLARTDRGRPVLLAGVAAGFAWLFLIGWTAAVGRSGALLHRLSGVMGIPEWGIVVATLATGALVAATGAWVGVTAGRRPQQHPSAPPIVPQSQPQD